MAEGESASSDGRVRRVGKAITALPGAGLVFAPSRTAGFVLQSWWRGRHPADPEALPVPPVTLALAGQVALDEALLAVIKSPRMYPQETDYAGVSEEIHGAIEFYRSRGWLERPAGYHRTPPAPANVFPARSWAAGLLHDRLSWPSGYEPFEGEPGRDRWLSYEANKTAYARVVYASEPDRPWLVCVHGLGTGWPLADFFAFRARRMARDLGINVLLPVLPLHGPRKVGRVGGRELLSYQVQNFVLGMAQAIWDIRTGIAWARAHGATRIGVYGMSLGAYVAGLLATVEPGLDLVISGAPLCDVPHLFQVHAPAQIRDRALREGLTAEMLTEAHRVVSPMSSPPLVDRDKLFVFGGVGDRMSTPDQAKRVWEHWGRPRMAWYQGSHTTFVFSAEVARFIEQALVDVGFVSPERLRKAGPPATADSTPSPTPTG